MSDKANSSIDMSSIFKLGAVSLALIGGGLFWMMNNKKPEESKPVDLDDLLKKEETPKEEKPKARRNKKKTVEQPKNEETKKEEAKVEKKTETKSETTEKKKKKKNKKKTETKKANTVEDVPKAEPAVSAAPSRNPWLNKPQYKCDEPTNSTCTLSACCLIHASFAL